MAMLAELINNMAQGKAYKNMSLKDFIPNFLGDEPKDRQAEAEVAFANKYLAMTGQE